MALDARRRRRFRIATFLGTLAAALLVAELALRIAWGGVEPEGMTRGRPSDLLLDELRRLGWAPPVAR